MTAGTLAGLFVPLLIGLVALVYVLATQGKFFFFPREGEIFTIKKGGELHRFVSAVKGWHFDEDGVLVPNNGPPPPQSLLRELFGIEWMGPWPIFTLHEYDFEWNKLGKKNENDTEFSVIPKKAKVNSLYFQFPYVFHVPKVETSGNVTVDVWVQATVQMRIPEIALFKSHKWLTALTGYIQTAVKELIGGHEVSHIQTIGEDTFDRAMRALNDEVTGAHVGLLKLIGGVIIDACIVSYEINTDAETAKELLAVEIARVKADATRITADADNYRLRQTTGWVAADPRRVEVEKWDALRGTVEVYVEGGPNENLRPIVIPTNKRGK